MRLSNISEGKADVLIDGRHVGEVVRESVTVRDEFREEVGDSTNLHTSPMGSQTVEYVHEVTRWTARVWRGPNQVDIGSAATRREAALLFEGLT